MYKNIIEVFEVHLKNIKFDNKLYKQLKAFKDGWVTKDINTMSFLGSNLLGVYPIRFTKTDDEELMEQLLRLDIHHLSLDLHALPDIDPTRKVSSNVIYLTLAYLIHGFLNSTHIGKNMEDAVSSLFHIMSYRMISSLVSHYFEKYNVEMSVAITVSEKMSNQFLLKKLGSWQEVFKYKSNAVLPPDGLNYPRLLKLDTVDTTLAIANIQGDIRGMVKQVYKILVSVNESNEKISNRTQEQTDLSGDKVLSDITNRPDLYVNYTLGIIYSRNDFIKEDLIYVIQDVIKATSKKDLIKVLDYICMLYMQDIKKVTFIVESIMKISIEYIGVNEHSYTQNIVDTLVALKNYFTGSKVKDPVLIELKETLLDVVKHGIHKTNRTPVVNARIGVILYIFLRTISKDNYK